METLERVNLRLQRNYHAFRTFEEGPPERRFGWLINLLQFQVEETIEHWEEVAPELAAFAARNTNSAMVKEAMDLSQDEIKELILPLKRGLERLMAGQPWQLRLLPTSRTFTKLRDMPFEAMPDAKDFRAAVLDEVCEAVTELGDRLEICARPGCGKAFVRRKRATHCSNACAQKERTERYMKKLAEKHQTPSARHKRYVASVRRKHGDARIVRPRSKKETGK
jgi:hypothetical protein